MYKLSIASKEQNVTIGDGYTAELRYNVFGKYWYYNLIDSGGNYLFYGLSLKPFTNALYFTETSTNVPKLFVVDEAYGDKEPYNPYVELGGRLGVYTL